MAHNYYDRLVSEATYEYADLHGGMTLGAAIQESGHLPLATMARKPETIAAVNRAREAVGIDRIREIARQAHAAPTEGERAAIKAVWDTMPGYTCFNDAAVIAARL